MEEIEYGWRKIYFSLTSLYKLNSHMHEQTTMSSPYGYQNLKLSF